MLRAGALLWAVLAAWPALANAAEQAPEPAREPALSQTAQRPAPQILLYAVQLRQSTLSESLITYGEPEDPLLPLGELSRLLELAIDVNPPEGRASGVIGQSQRTLVVDLASRVASLGGSQIALADGDWWVAGTDLYLRASLLEKLLPLTFAIDPADLRLTIEPSEPLPVEQRSQRERRRLSIGAAPSLEADAYRIDNPYRWIGYPAFDFGAEIGRDDGRNGFTRRFEVRVAADVLKSTFTGFVGTDDTGRPASANLRLERRDPAGEMLGPLGASYLALGDVYTPALSLGPRSFGGQGAVVSNATLETADVFDRITLRGELPLGYDVELYVNDILRGSQNQAAEGRYEFLDVPLVRGVNIVRIVLFGPRGERQESTRVINLGGGLLDPGKVEFQAGFVLQERPVIEFERGELVSSGAAKGEPRAIASASVGLTQTLTGSAALSAFSDFTGARHELASVGLRGSLAGVAVQADLAHDFGLGSALAIGGAGRLGETAYSLRHIEYSGDFADESNFLYNPGRPLARYSEMQLDLGLSVAMLGGLPLSLRGRRAEYADGGATLSGQVRTTLTALDTLFAVASDLQRQTFPGGKATVWSGNLAASRRVGLDWQLRASVDTEFLPTTRVRALAVTADRSLDERFGVRGGLAKSFGSIDDLTVFGAATARLPFADAALTADYATERNEWRLGLQVNFGLAFDPFARRYRMSRPGPASNASAALLAFIDDNANGRRDSGEAAVEGVRLGGGDFPATTDAEGQAFLTGLGNGPNGILRTDTTGLDLFFMTSPPQNVVFTPRAGEVLAIPYPFVSTSEVVVSLVTEQADGDMAGLAAVRFALVDERGVEIPSATEFDGRAVFESVRPGRYAVRLEPDQAERLRMTLEEPVEIEVTSEGRVIRARGVIRFERGTLQ